jgi:hypothetical protein
VRKAFGSKLARVPLRYREAMRMRDKFPAGWMMWLGKKQGSWSRAGRYKLHLTSGEFKTWCGNIPPLDASVGAMGGPSHVSQICCVCRALAIEAKLEWHNLLWVPTPKETP